MAIYIDEELKLQFYNVFNAISLICFHCSLDHEFCKMKYDSEGNPVGHYERNKGELIALMHSELSECLEAIRQMPIPQDKHIPAYSSEVVELADAIIRIMDYSAAHNLPLASAIIAKILFNDTRPIKHGKEF